MLSLTRAVSFSFPAGTVVERQDLGADPLMAAFVAMIAEQVNADATLHICYRCPPDVQIIRSKIGNALARAERFDTLMVEYLRLKNGVLDGLLRGIAPSMVESVINQWYVEFFLGYEMPLYALSAATRLVDRSGVFMASSVSHAEAMADIGDTLRLALQGTLIAHEYFHLLEIDRKGLTHDHPHQGISPIQHIRWNLEHFRTEKPEADQIVDVFRRRINPEHLHEEIDADVFAFQSVAGFLHRVCDHDIADSVFIALEAFEAFSFLQSLKTDVALLKRLDDKAIDVSEFVDNSNSQGLVMVARTRTILRLAAFYWCYQTEGSIAVSDELVETRRRQIDTANAEGFELVKTLNKARRDIEEDLLKSIYDLGKFERAARLETLRSRFNSEPMLSIVLQGINMSMGFDPGRGLSQ